jgi:hypothetical protein
MIRRRTVSATAAAAYACMTFAALVGPAVVVRLAAIRNGVMGSIGLDLVVGSALVGAVQAMRVLRALRGSLVVPTLRRAQWLAVSAALVVLAASATLLLTVVLVAFAAFHADLAAAGYPVVLLWIGVQTAAVVLSELVGRTVFRWLAAEHHSVVSASTAATMAVPRPPTSRTSGPEDRVVRRGPAR